MGWDFHSKRAEPTKPYWMRFIQPPSIVLFFFFASNSEKKKIEREKPKVLRRETQRESQYWNGTKKFFGCDLVAEQRKLKKRNVLFFSYSFFCRRPSCSHDFTNRKFKRHSVGRIHLWVIITIEWGRGGQPTKQQKWTGNKKKFLKKKLTKRNFINARV